MPRVSICIPAYKPQHFETCLTSAIAQTFQDIEIIVSDDCPTDAIKQICDKYPGKINYSRNTNPGARNNFLRTLSLAQGEYIKPLFDDDILHPFCVQCLFQALEASRHADTTLAFSPRGTIDGDNNLTGVINQLKISGPGASIIKGDQLIALIAANCMNCIGEFSTAMFRRVDTLPRDGRELIDFPGLRSEGLGDVQTWINLAERGNIIAHPETLSYFRRHQGANSDPNTNPNFIHVITEWEDVVNYAAAKGHLTDQKLNAAYNSLLRLFNAWIENFPQLAANIARVEQKQARLAA